MTTSIVHLPEREDMLSGNRTCAGCGLAIALRHILKALDGKAIFVVPASCLTVLGGMYPISSVRVPWMNVVFPGVAAAATGLVAGLRATRRSGLTVVAMAGDGGTCDIGLQGLSGAAERNDDFIYICYDNEAYMNTGTQRSGTTPCAALTSTTPAPGKQQFPKDMPRIMEAHGVPYIATACAAYPNDLYDKVLKARAMTGLRYIHLSTPCPPGWSFPATDTIAMGRAAVESGFVVLYEIEHGRFQLTGKSLTLASVRTTALKPLANYFAPQGRYKGMDTATLESLQHWVNKRWQACLKRQFPGVAAEDSSRAP
jgi:pyruvate ferredoxin oxidoreductase beta subunit